MTLRIERAPETVVFDWFSVVHEDPDIDEAGVILRMPDGRCHAWLDGHGWLPPDFQSIEEALAAMEAARDSA